GRWRRRASGTPTAAPSTARSRCTAGSASRGSTTCTSGSSGRAGTRWRSATRSTSASGWRRSITIDRARAAPARPARPRRDRGRPAAAVYRARTHRIEIPRTGAARRPGHVVPPPSVRGAAAGGDGMALARRGIALRNGRVLRRARDALGTPRSRGPARLTPPSRVARAPARLRVRRTRAHALHPARDGAHHRPRFARLPPPRHGALAPDARPGDARADRREPLRPPDRAIPVRLGAPVHPLPDAVPRGLPGPSPDPY